ncbi:MAG TPA: UDP-N-acetylmuramoyl-L-alanyl-D-glutamate--2,6-diaminopimelate ligase [Nevskiaceae bacterium]|nr:UDP-N-acetylmuramoyl-L-alanyl-D-glutamate--2,6-diaminopimelate ligase [Nevskiaceae bacterium]
MSPRPAGLPRARNPRLLANLFAGFGAAAPRLAVTGLQMDSRRVEAGDLFLAVRGVGGHGLAHVEQALAQGAAAVAWEPAPGIAEPDTLPVPQFAVPALAARVGEIAARFHDRPGEALRLYGVTGTDGKTSTAHLLAQTLDRLGEPCAYIGTLGAGRLGALAANPHTTPDPITLQGWLADYREAGLKACAMEVSSHALDQARVAGLAFDAALLSNVGRDHLDYHGSLEAYAAAKQRLFTVYRRGEAVLNRDDAHGAAWAGQLRAQQSHPALTVYGLDGERPAPGQRFVIGRELRLHGEGLALQLDTSWGAASLQTRLLGRFNAYNLLACLSALLATGVPLAEAVAALAQAQTVPGRIEGFRGSPAQPLVVVDYAHTPQALEQILSAVRAHCRGRLVAVFGCGGDRDRGKRPLMGRAAAQGADALIVTDDNPRSEDPAAIVAEILSGIDDPGAGRHPGGDRAASPAAAPRAASVEVIHDRAAAIRRAVALAGPDDIVVVAGKGHETTQTQGREVRAFSDRRVVAELLGLEPRP